MDTEIVMSSKITAKRRISAKQARPMNRAKPHESNIDGMSRSGIIAVLM